MTGFVTATFHNIILEKGGQVTKSVIRTCENNVIQYLLIDKVNFLASTDNKAFGCTYLLFLIGLALFYTQGVFV